jgi:Ca-activated chloride channel family protein
MSFLWPRMLLTLLALPLLVWFYFRLQRRRTREGSNLGPLGVVQNPSGRQPGFRRHTPPMLYFLGLALLLIGLARPEMPVNLPRVEGTVILAFDVSNSMAAEDMQPTRMQAAKAAARTFIENQPPTITIGVVAFSNGGLVVQPPTDDRAALVNTIDRLTPQSGTSLGQGIFTSLNAIAGQPIALDAQAVEENPSSIEIGDYPSAVILMLTDGENTGPPDPLEIAQVAAQAGVRIYPVGIGSPEGTIIEVNGFNIQTQLNESTLKDIASLTNGQYYRAEDETSLQEIYKNVDLRLTVKGEQMEVTSVVAGLSLLPLLIGGLLSMLWFGRAP